jgi:DNA-binding MarR family transcriptional regulator
VEKGVAVRFRPEHDRRVVLVELSAKAKAHRDALFSKRVELVEKMLAPLRPAVREQVACVFGEIAQSAAAHAAALRNTA